VEAVLHRDASVEAMIDSVLSRPYRSE